MEQTTLYNPYEESLVNRMNDTNLSDYEKIDILIELTTLQSLAIDSLERKVAEMESKTYLTLD